MNKIIDNSQIIDGGPANYNMITNYNCQPIISITSKTYRIDALTDVACPRRVSFFRQVTTTTLFYQRWLSYSKF